MRQLFSIGAAAAVLICAGSAHALPVKFDTGTGATNHWYEFINSTIAWTTAKAAAEGMTLNAPGDPLHGAPGHLVTLGSAEEATFTRNLVNPQVGIWIGLTDDSAFGGTEFGNTSALPNPSPGQTAASEAGVQKGEGWVWITGEPVVYQNWNPGEPNNVGGGGEQYADMSVPFGTIWTDRNNTSDGGRAYVVEYSVVPEPASAAAAGFLATGMGMIRRRRR